MNDMTRQRIVLDTPEMAQVAVERGRVYREVAGARLGLDLYRPPAPSPSSLPAILFVTGYADEGFKGMLGCIMQEMGAYISWAQLVATAGMVGITYENRDPAADAFAALRHVIDHARELNIDPERVGIWSCSGNVPNALGLLCDAAQQIACAALCYGYTLDLPGDRHVQDAAAQFRFAHRPGSTTMERLPRLPMLMARAGCDDTPGLNRSIDRFVGAALERNDDLTLINFPEGHHAFDLNDETDASRETIRSILYWMAGKLHAHMPTPIRQGTDSVSVRE